jgi:hypothetical protein
MVYFFLKWKNIVKRKASVYVSFCNWRYKEKESRRRQKGETFPVGFCALYFEIKILHMRNLTRYSSFFSVKHLGFMLRKGHKCIISHNIESSPKCKIIWLDITSSNIATCLSPNNSLVNKLRHFLSNVTLFYKRKLA